jgi:hypothetical protein
MAPDLRARLSIRGHGVPVIQPVWAAVAFARMLVTLGMKHSGLTYPPPPVALEMATAALKSASQPG